jgi:hypothetical protein
MSHYDDFQTISILPAVAVVLLILAVVLLRSAAGDEKSEESVLADLRAQQLEEGNGPDEDDDDDLTRGKCRGTDGVRTDTTILPADDVVEQTDSEICNEAEALLAQQLG